ncbi:MAG: hypothetical protein BGN98_12760 [Microbacterium sp. 69-7]|nr:MAG: hypothetical protein BGN98_12760 [Microbacterium sp. 69-7]
MPRIRHALGAVLLVLAIGVFPFASGSAALADDATPPPGDVGVATRPAGPDGRPDNRARFSYTADPGQSVTDQVYVGNTGTERQDFTVVATDALNGPDGAFNLLPTAETPSGLGSWVTFENGQNRIQFSLEPQEVRLLTFAVAFPADATPGDHVGGIVASVVQEGQQVNLDRRVATAVFARVSGDLQPRLTLASFDATFQGDWWNLFGGTLKVLYTVNNPGNVALAANLTMSTATWFGIPAAGDQGGSTPVLLPGNSATYEFDINGVGQWGYLNPSARLQPFADTTDVSQQVLVTPVSRDTVVVALPWTLLIAAAVVTAIVLLLRWRRRRDEARAQEWIAYTEQQAAAAAEAKVRAVAAAAPADS